MAAPAQAQQSSTAKNPAPIGLRIADAMHKLGVQGCPKNYELFYNALTGINPELSSDFWALGRTVTQDQLDALYKKHFEARNSQVFVERAREVLEQNLTDAIEVLKDEQSSMTAYGRVLDKTTRTVSVDNDLSPETFLHVIEVLANATGSTLSRGRQALSSMIDKSNELETLKTELEEYKRLVDTDPLTGVWNRRAFDNHISRIGVSNKTNGALLVIDIDNFKQVNDTHGHPFGDVVIRDVAQIIRSKLRQGVFLARTGGEEFVAFLEQTDAKTAMSIAGRLLAVIREYGFCHDDVSLRPGDVTISIGVCTIPPATSGVELYMRADQALYTSKADGRDRATLYEEAQQSASNLRRKNYYIYRD